MLSAGILGWRRRTPEDGAGEPGKKPVLGGTDTEVRRELQISTAATCTVQIHVRTHMRVCVCVCVSMLTPLYFLDLSTDRTWTHRCPVTMSNDIQEQRTDLALTPCSLNPQRNRIFAETTNSRAGAWRTQGKPEHLVMPESSVQKKRWWDVFSGSRMKGPPTGQIWDNFSTNIIKCGNEL